MITFREYLRAGSLEEAWKANQKRANRVVGGMGWMKMSKRTLGTIIDLSGLGLNTIEETEEEFVLGAMATLHDLEVNDSLNAYFDGAFKEATRHIVGVQFRNCATIGGSVWLKAGFSDPFALLLVLDAEVELYQGNESYVRIPIREFANRKADYSILTRIYIKKDGRKVAYQSFRNTETDFPVLAVALAKTEAGYVASVGARPYRAEAIEGSTVEELKEKAQALSYDKNIRASAEYRQMLSGVLLTRAAEELERR